MYPQLSAGKFSHGNNIIFVGANDVIRFQRTGIKRNKFLSHAVLGNKLLNKKINLTFFEKSTIFNSNFILPLFFEGKRMKSKNRLYLKGPFIFYLITIMRVFIGLIFTFSAIMKIIDLQAFYISLIKFNLLPDSFINVFKWSIPLFELFLGIAILLNKKIEIFLELLIYLLTFFTTIVFSKILAGQDISCSCFGNLSNSKIDYYMIIRNVSLIIIIFFILLFLFKRKYSTSNIQVIFHYKILFVTLIIIVLAVQNSLFSIENRELKTRIGMLVKPQILKEGDVVSAFSTYDLNDKKLKIDYSNYDYTLLLISKTTCEYCKKNIPLWSQFFEIFAYQNQVKIINVFVDSPVILKDYINKCQYYISCFYNQG